MFGGEATETLQKKLEIVNTGRVKVGVEMTDSDAQKDGIGNEVMEVGMLI